MVVEDKKRVEWKGIGWDSSKGSTRDPSGYRMLCIFLVHIIFSTLVVILYDHLAPVLPLRAHFLFCQVQFIWSYVEVFDLLGLQFCAE